MAKSADTTTRTGPSVVVSGDRMTAVLRIPADSAESQVTVHGLMALVRDTGLPTGDDTTALLDQAVRQFHDWPRELRVTVGQGVAPVRGEPGRLEWQEGLGPEQLQAQRDIGEEPVNYYELDKFVSVGQGQHIATLIPPKPGQPGFDVYGQRLAPSPGQPWPLQADPTVRILADGRVLANRAGLLNATPHRIHVSPVLQIARQVDFSTGNVRFDGSVMIGLGVRDRFTVEATEDVIANKLIEAAHITCGGRFRAEGGMAGRDAGTIHVGRHAFARYLVGVSGSVAGDLEVTKEIINCQLTVGGSVSLTGGSLIGGRLVAAGRVSVAELGSDAGVLTTVEMGVVEGLRDSLNRLGAALPAIDERLDMLRAQLDNTSAKPGDTHAQRARLATAIEQFTRKRQQVADKLDQLARQFDAACRVDLRVFRTIHPAVVLSLPRLKLKFHTPLPGPVTLRRHRDGRIRADAASGKEVSIHRVARVLHTATW